MKRLCPECNFGANKKLYPGTKMVRKTGKFGEFMGCERYPLCKCSCPTDETLAQRQAEYDAANKPNIFCHESPFDLC